jgi:hypothetical protein
MNMPNPYNTTPWSGPVNQPTPDFTTPTPDPSVLTAPITDPNLGY